MSNSLYAFGRQSLGTAALNLSSDTIQAVLCTATYVANLATDQHLSDIAGGAQIATVTLTGQALTNGVFTASNLVFGSVLAGSTITQMVLYKSTGVAATSALIFLITRLTMLMHTATLILIL